MCLTVRLAADEEEDWSPSKKKSSPPTKNKKAVKSEKQVKSEYFETAEAAAPVEQKMAVIDVSKWTVAELKAELVARAAAKQGKKAELVERLQDLMQTAPTLICLPCEPGAGKKTAKRERPAAGKKGAKGKPPAWEDDLEEDEVEKKLLSSDGIDKEVERSSLLHSIPWLRIVLDEAHKIKARTSCAAIAMAADSPAAACLANAIPVAFLAAS